MKTISLHKMSCFQEQYSHKKIKIKIKLDLSHYATKCLIMQQNLEGVINTSLTRQNLLKRMIYPT